MIAWCVDDMKILHVKESVVTDVIHKIEEHFGKMTVTRGTKHVFLGMSITLNPDGTFDMNMKDYISEAVNQFEEDIGSPAHTPTSKGLFAIDNTSPKLLSEKQTFSTQLWQNYNTLQVKQGPTSYQLLFFYALVS
jgi:hypothetical protein